jgi:hypothetical protein
MTEPSSGLMALQTWALSTPMWAKHATYLHKSAELLWQPLQHMFDIYVASAAAGTAPKDHPGFDAESGRHAHAYLLVAGCALEAMLKAAAIQRALNKQGPRGALTPDGKQLQGWLTNHELGALAKRATVT